MCILSVCVCGAQSVPVEAISYPVTLYSSSVCQRQIVESDLYVVWHSCPRIPRSTAAKRPLTESGHWPNMPPLGTSTWANTQSHTHTNTDKIHKEKLEAHAPTHHALTHLRAERKKRIVLWVRKTGRRWFVSESVWYCYGWHLAVRQSVATWMPGGVWGCWQSPPPHLLLDDGKGWQHETNWCSTNYS